MKTVHNLKVVINGVPSFKLDLEQSYTIFYLRNLLKDYIEGNTIKFFISDKEILDVFTNNKYDSLKMLDIWDKLYNPVIYITTKEKIYKDVRDKTTSECLKVASLRKKYGKNINLREWLKMKNHEYVGRHGRIFIDKEIFHYPDSKWGNPYKLKDYDIETSLRLYEEHVRNNLMSSLCELKGKILGCFCENDSPCHAKILVKLIDEYC